MKNYIYIECAVSELLSLEKQAFLSLVAVRCLWFWHNSVQYSDVIEEYVLMW